MINQLRKLYPSFKVHRQDASAVDPAYKWFIADDGQTFGIHESELTQKDISLLTAFLTPYNPIFPAPTEDERSWLHALNLTAANLAEEFILKSSFRFVHFSIQENQISPTAFKHAIHDLFAKQVPILWINEHQGCLIEYVPNEADIISYSEIIDVLMSDLYIKIQFFVGPIRHSLMDAAVHYQTVLLAAKTSAAFSTKAVISYTDAVPYLLIDQAPQQLLDDIGQSVLKAYRQDEETLKMIEVFVRNSLNISETAKALHMHRNSLQYRLDRFHDNTGVDIRNFHEAMAVYLAILMTK